MVFNGDLMVFHEDFRMNDHVHITMEHPFFFHEITHYFDWVIFNSYVTLCNTLPEGNIFGGVACMNHHEPPMTIWVQFGHPCTTFLLTMSQPFREFRQQVARIMEGGAVGPPPCFKWVTIPSTSSIYHQQKPYLTYLYQLRYRTGAPPWLVTNHHSSRSTRSPWFRSFIILLDHHGSIYHRGRMKTVEDIYIYIYVHTHQQQRIIGGAW